MNECKSFLGGVCIGLACVCYISIDNPIIGAFMFSVGLLTIIHYNFQLYTGMIGLVGNRKDVFKCVQVFLFNSVGVCMVLIASMLTMSQEKFNKLVTISNAKMNKSLYQIFIESILCGILMLFATKKKDNTIVTIMCVATFVLCGFEHSVADVFLMALGSNYFVNIATVLIGNAIGAIVVNRIMER